MRTLRSKSQRAQLWLNHNGRCAICGSELKRSWEADHKIPFKITKDTIFENMQPTCPTCNRKKGDKMTKNRSYYESLNLASSLDISPMRIGQKGAFNCIVEKVLDNCSTISIVLPTRYGKSDVMRASAIELIERGTISGCLIAAPCKFLRDQLVKKKKLEEMVQRYTIATPIVHDVLDNFRLPIFQNDETFVALTTQMLSSNADQIAAYIKQKIAQTGKTVLVYIDESHTSSEANVWGAVVPKVVNAGGIVILCTATPYRDNGEKIPGFNCVEGDVVEKKVCKVRPHEEEIEKYYLDTFRDLQSTVKLIADYEYSFKSAWAEGNVICKVSRNEFDVVAKIPINDEGETKEIKISEMTTKDCNKYFGKVVRDEKVVRGGVSILLERMRDFRLSEPTSQAIIFCGNDFDDVDDGHAKQIATEISCQDATYKVVIATSKQNDPDLVIKRFGEGHGDILIVKQMASLGLDIPPIKLGLDLSSVRTLAAFVQRMMRVATMWGNNQIAHFIMPADVNGRSLWKGFVEENGGSYIAHNLELVKTEEKEKSEDESDSNKTFEVIRTENATLSDTSGAGFSGADDYHDFVQPLIRFMPKVQGVYSDYELVSFAKMLGKDTLDKCVAAPPPVVRDITEQRSLLSKQINFLINEVVKGQYNYGTDKEQFIAAKKKLTWEAKQNAGVKSKKIKLSKITNLDTLVRMKNFLENRRNASINVDVDKLLNVFE